VDFEQSFLANLPLIEEVARKTCRRHRVRAEDAEDFVSLARLKFLADDYQVLRRFQGKSTLSTYVTTVVQHLFLDYCNQTWGRYRPSTEAQRRGPLAIELERLSVRDELPLADAIRAVALRHPEVDAAELQAIAEALPRRNPRHKERDDVLESLPTGEVGPEEGLVDADRSRAAAAARRALQSALQHLPSEDRLVLRLRSEENLPVADIARSLGIDAKALYRRLARLYRDLKGDLVDRGISSQVLRGDREPPGRYADSVAKPRGREKLL
jgi:RNA polymerase sigma factor (sigma-70 family)